MAGTVTVSYASAPRELGGDINEMQVLFTCKGDASDGSIPNKITTDLTGWYLTSVAAWPVPGGIAPDAADVFILTDSDKGSEDLLGSTDGGTTALGGLNLIHATLRKSSIPLTTNGGDRYFPVIRGRLTLKVLNQATVSADYIVELTLVR